jgi:hypothetical protein
MLAIERLGRAAHRCNPRRFANGDDDDDDGPIDDGAAPSGRLHLTDTRVPRRRV